MSSTLDYIQRQLLMNWTKKSGKMSMNIV